MLKFFIYSVSFLCIGLSSSVIAELNAQEVFTIVEVMPQYPGGEKAMFEYLQQNTVYPNLAKEKEIEGTVYVTFIVSEAGEIKDVQLLRASHHLLGEEAVRVVKAMPNWIPGTQGGKRVAVKYNLPIKFSLSGKKKKKK